MEDLLEGSRKLTRVYIKRNKRPGCSRLLKWTEAFLNSPIAKPFKNRKLETVHCRCWNEVQMFAWRVRIFRVVNVFLPPRAPGQPVRTSTPGYSFQKPLTVSRSVLELSLSLPLLSSTLRNPGIQRPLSFQSMVTVGIFLTFLQLQASLWTLNRPNDFYANIHCLPCTCEDLCRG